VTVVGDNWGSVGWVGVKVSTNTIMDTIDGRRRRRTWTAELKREIVAASFEPGASTSVVAQRYNVNTNQLFLWRRLYRKGSLAVTSASEAALLPVTITGDPVAEQARAAADIQRIEIELPNGCRLRVDSAVDGKALRRILDVLERR
jgi:transposase